MLQVQATTYECALGNAQHAVLCHLIREHPFDKGAGPFSPVLRSILSRCGAQATRPRKAFVLSSRHMEPTSTRSCGSCRPAGMQWDAMKETHTQMQTTHALRGR